LVDGTLLKAWASMKSFRPKNASGEDPGSDPGEPPPGRNGEIDKDARLFRKGAGQESRLAYLGHVLMENRNGLVAGAEATLATGTAEREAAAAFNQRLPKGATLGADKDYDAEAFVEDLKARGIAPHIAINGTVSKHGKARGTAIPSEIAASLGYATSQRLRKRIEEGFGWTKTVGCLMQVKVRGLARVRAAFIFAMAAYNIVRLPKLIGPMGQASSDMKSRRTMTQRQARSSKISGIRPQKIALVSLVAQTQ
jgi:hypothetical protein